MTRRTFGSARKLASGHWQASYWFEGRRFVAPTVFMSKADANAYLSDVETSTRRGSWIDPHAGDVLLEDFARKWLDERTNLRPRTAAKYRYLIDRYVLPQLGQRSLSSLKPSSIRSWYAVLAAEHPTAAADAYRVLKSIFKTAVGDEVITRNPCQLQGAGVVRSTERPIATVAEVNALAEAMPEHMRALVLLAAWCGLRRGEVLGLQRQDVDELHGAVQIERTVTHMTSGEWLLGPPKTDAGRRVVHYPPNIGTAISRHLANYVDAQPGAWLFGSEVGTPLPLSTLARAWGAARRAVGRPDLHLHDLRHTGATLAAIAGATTKELMTRMGHSSPVAALRYQHATRDRDRALAAALAELATGGELVPIERSSPTKDGRTNSS